jgi:heavy metal sensor kinase
MTIRKRVTLWYVGMLLVSLIAMMVVLHYEWKEQLDTIRKEHREPDPVWEEAGEVALYYGLPTMLILLAGGWLVLRRALAPIGALTGAIERIHLQNLTERLPLNNQGDELDRLTEVFNAMMERLEKSVENIKEFTLHASHELKTPLTIMRGEIETALRQGGSPPEHQEMLSNQLEEIQRLAKIVDGLALLARADAGQMKLQQSPVALKELVEDSFADAQILAQPRRVTVKLESCDNVTVLGDRNRLRQLLLNLTENAIKYNQPEGEVNIALTRSNGTVQLKISNTGPGIPPEKLPRVFERFFRVDESHRNGMESCGLGLSIAQWIVKAHHGSISISSLPGQWTTLSVLLPANA